MCTVGFLPSSAVHVWGGGCTVTVHQCHVFHTRCAVSLWCRYGGRVFFPYSWQPGRLWWHWLPGESSPGDGASIPPPLYTHMWLWWVVLCWRLHRLLIPDPIHHLGLRSSSLLSTRYFGFQQSPFFLLFTPLLWVSSWFIGLVVLTSLYLFFQYSSSLPVQSTLVFIFTIAPNFCPIRLGFLLITILSYSLQRPHLVDYHFPHAPWAPLDSQLPGMLSIFGCYRWTCPHHSFWPWCLWVDHDLQHYTTNTGFFVSNMW